MENISIQLGAKQYEMWPSYEAYSQIEQGLNASLSDIYTAHLHGRLMLNEIAKIVYYALAGQNEKMTVEAIEKRLFEGGVQDLQLKKLIGQYLLALGYSPENAAKKFQAEWSEETLGLKH